MLTPFIIFDEDLEKFEEEFDTEIPSKTYKIDFETGEIYTQTVDGDEAIKQAVIKAIKTSRDRYIIYSEDYGSELDYLVGQSFSEEYLKLEVPRLVKETLMPDDRIEDATDFDIEVIGDGLHIYFKVIPVVGDTISVEVRFNV